ncbi:two-component sensor histidine kinase [Georgenia sp. EYE_87]|uniref:sensor histidine kinase n=1 Tax=Georgenia sp. EYE_87 TaxID=2853448 RepID=UPI002003DE54|nr:histidine kinase [Georgenia sp. EYE_87]MCK6210990.1 two-component sensor histidine kinase [Georgenia sp. EYE_87]
MRRAGPVRRFVLGHPRAVDAIVVAVFLVPAVLGELAPEVLADGARGPAERATVAAVVLLTALALWWRRSAPVRVLTATTALLALSLAVTRDTTTVEVAAVLALYAVAAYRPASTAWGCLALLNVVSGASLLLWMDVTQETAVLTTTTPHSETVQEVSQLQALVVLQITVLVLSVVAVALGTGARGRRLHVESLLERTRQLVLERDQREQLAVSAERTRIAREMHDVVAHSLSVMITLADGASAAMTRRPDLAREALEQLAETGRSALADTRRMVGVLREDSPAPAPGPAPGPADGSLGGDVAPLAPQPAAHDLADLVERFRVTGLPVRLTESGPPLPEDAGLQLAVYRIVQECLTNVLRYARLSPRIDVTVERLDGRVVVTVDNDSGTAGDAMVGSGRGLIGIRERAAVYDGHVEAGPTPTGWRVRAELGWNWEGRG